MPPRGRRLLSTFASDARWPGWQAVIGIEVHAQIKSRAKLFSPSSTATESRVNTNVTLFDAAFPGSLPKLNAKCVELAVRTSLALGANVNKSSTFDRKHYFYPDLPSGYQITQKYAPLALGGYLASNKDGSPVRIEQIQLEQDTAKSTKVNSSGTTRIDLNRAGVALMEIVSRPDMRSPEDAGSYVRALQAVLRAVGASDGNMEQGSLRCDINVSINREGEPFGTRCEVKNLNSVRNLMSAIISEVNRHITLRSAGLPVPQETRGFDEERAQTYTLRSKEDAPDYRYMPDPNLPPLILSDNYISGIAHTMPELPSALLSRLQSQYGISKRDAEILISLDASNTLVGWDGEPGDGSLVRYFEGVANGGDAKMAVNWITHELLGQLAYREQSFLQNPIKVETMRELLEILKDGTLTNTAAKTLLRHLLDHPQPSPDLHNLITSLSLAAPNGAKPIETYCQEAIAAHPRESAVIRAGNERVIMKLVGWVIKASKGTVDARKVQAVLKQMLMG